MHCYGFGHLVDVHIQELRRTTAGGDPAAREKLRAALIRSGMVDEAWRVLQDMGIALTFDVILAPYTTATSSQVYPLNYMIHNNIGKTVRIRILVEDV